MNTSKEYKKKQNKKQKTTCFKVMNTSKEYKKKQKKQKTKNNLF